MKDYQYNSGSKSVYRFTEKRYDSFGKVISEAEVDCSGSEPTQTQLTAPRIAYTYDGVGYRLSETKDEVLVENTYNGLNQMLTSGDSSFDYDANGNLIKEIDSIQDMVKTYAYDADNRLSEAVFTNEGTQALSQKNTYNGDGQRISKTDNNVTTKYSYQEGSVVYTEGSNENKSLNIMGEVGNIIAAERGTGSYFYNKDMRGSTTTILDGTGNGKVSYEYFDFGDTSPSNELCELLTDLCKKFPNL